jgi:hypothetical protein
MKRTHHLPYSSHKGRIPSAGPCGLGRKGRLGPAHALPQPCTCSCWYSDRHKDHRLAILESQMPSPGTPNCNPQRPLAFNAACTPPCRRHVPSALQPVTRYHNMHTRADAHGICVAFAVDTLDSPADSPSRRSNPARFRPQCGVPRNKHDLGDVTGTHPRRLTARCACMRQVPSRF